MATSMLANILITAVISNGFLAAASPVVPAKPQHPTAQRQMSLEIPVADQQERILKFLSLFDEAQKSAIPTADPKISGIKGQFQRSHQSTELLSQRLKTTTCIVKGSFCISGKNASTKMYGKKVETKGVSEGPSLPPSELRKDLLEISPLHGKNFWKPSLPTSWKIKRACFWKYCIERK